MKKSKSYTQILILLFSFAFTASCNGQKKTDLPKNDKNQLKLSAIHLKDSDPYFVESKTITASSGPSSITRNIIQDSKGNIWLATWEGIIQYDPVSGKFTNFTNKEGLRRFHAFAVLEDSKGNLWFGTIGAGVYRYDGKSFTNFTTKEGLANNRVTSIYEDKSGHIWFGTEGGASCYRGESLLTGQTGFRNFTTEDGLTNNDVNVIIQDKTGKWWFGTRGDAFFYDGKTFTKFTNQRGDPFTNVRSIIEDKNGHIWLGGNDGLWRYDGRSFTNFTTNFIGYIYEDSTGNIWTSSEGANSRTWVLSRYDIELPLPYLKATATQIRTEEGMFFGILEDKEGGIWFGTLNGVCRYDGKSFNYFRDKEARD